MRRTITRSVILSTCVVFAISMLVALFLRSKQPKYKGEKELSGLQANTEVLFDKWAIPHIYAENELDAYRSLGYLHAQDRLFQMEMMRRLAKGELAEILGPDLVKIDKLFRTLGIRHIAERLAKKHELPNAASAAFKAYLAGINTFIASGPKPIEFQVLGITPRPFESTDSFAIAGYMAFSFVKALQTDPLITFLNEQLPTEFSAEVFNDSVPHQTALKGEKTRVQFLENLAQYAHTLLKQPFEYFEGSNAWAISGQLTRSGKPILANDPHIGFSNPSVWYEASLEYPNFKLYGHYLAGVPVALLGHNDMQGWGVTMLQNKDSDFYQEKLNPENPNQVWFKDHWEDLEVRTELIKVKGQEDVSLEVKSSRHGPIVNGIVDGFSKTESPISFLWEFANDENGIFEAFYELARSKNRHEAENAVSKIHSPGLNIMYANAEGDIAWWAAGRFPILPEHAKGKFLLDGASGEDEYEGFHPFSSHPHIVNPEEGFIVSANQNPFRTHDYQVRGYYNPDYRYDRIKEHLSSKASFWTADEMKKIQLQTENQSYRKIIASVTPILEAEKGSEINEAAVTLFKTWDLEHSIESQGATVFHEFLGRILEKVFHERLTDTFYESLRRSNLIHEALVQVLTNSSSPWWNDKDGKNQNKEWILETWNQTVNALTQALGDKPLKWNWGRVHTVVHKHILGHNKYLAWFFNIGPLAANGSTEVINNFNFTMSSGIHEVHSGPSTRRIIDFANAGESWGINPTGQSGYFANSHYQDQAAMYHQGEYRLQILDKKALKDTKRLVFLAPKKKD